MRQLNDNELRALEITLEACRDLMNERALDVTALTDRAQRDLIDAQAGKALGIISFLLINMKGAMSGTENK